MKAMTLKVAQRLALGFGLLVGMLALSSAISLVQLRRVSSRQHEITDVLMKEMAHLTAMRRDTLRAESVTRELLLSAPQARPAVKARLDGIRRDYDRQLADYRSLARDRGLSLLLDRAVAAEAATRAVADRVAAQALGHQDVAAVRLLLGAGTRTADARTALLQGAIDAHDRAMQTAIASIGRATRASTWTLLVFGALATVAGLLLAWRISRALVRPLQAATKAADEIARGTLDAEIAVVRDDEIGALMRAMRGMRDALRERIEREQRLAQEGLRIRTALDDVTTNVMIADADRTIVYANRPLMTMLAEAEQDIRQDLPAFEAASVVGRSIDQFHRNPAHQSSMLDRLQGTHRAQIGVGGRTMQLIINPVTDTTGARAGYVVEWADRTAELRVEQEVTRIVQAAVQGDLSGRISEIGKQGFLLGLSQQINGLLTAIATSVEAVSGVLQALSQGDLGTRMQGEFQGVFARMRDDANATVHQLTDIVSRIQDATGAITTASSEIAAGNQDLSRRTEQQAANLEETAASMEELTSTVRQNAESARQANQLAIGAAGVASQGGQVVGQVVATMSDIEQSSRRIAEIISVIDGIAFQTNILALNAAVEAARAGEQGRGFAVVASEVRTLAQRSANAAKEIKNLIETSVDKVADGARLVHQAGETMEEIVASVQRVTDIMGEISAASQEQSMGIEQINQVIVQMDGATQQNAALVEEATAAARAMEEQAQHLQDAAAVFRLELRGPHRELSQVTAHAA
ncbi:methyl-accepting chemotaxis protein [Pseudoxanthomonas japonensis]|uniref:Methyl-accepting chemotaxis protein n=1 Tax=Pseudoxanthomonas japonensis TaxID=69284 RepID=A0ABQ6ZL87_9GAMM|nr:methyl-accepting chemotaxis protein [Pseudoxanthomonas japonensis]KAF1726908.1 methyl-accepting chemotaxis protein [Pseudoxanthomonas japonensis]